ncbi:outer membrane protein assembly factor BamA [Candidatus Pantoea edessiphila]|uniref:Outer membrane protein assembly factor BamA n=1 Tax=Candidatus Pantoea edessiphila TaxID=2044610 RepID=A0A2P5SWA9_9GAMM|nr:outer membrane protein assembly factor BamA [Candidatus Pantoea edessiphila]PPI86627.1 outer membrane protein assembly factor BamA [Candidatus Pantoea edessiphila]
MSIKKLFLTFLLFITINVYGSDKITNINLKGLQRISSNVILSILPVKIGDEIDSNGIKNIIKSLYSTEMFQDIKVIQKGSSLIINVKELPVISKITIKGNDIIKTEKIENTLEHSNIFIGKILNESLIFSLKKSFEEFYFNVGKYNFRMKTVITPLPNNCVDLKFLFDEGVFTQIHQINIIGNNKFTYNKLISLFQSHDKISWWNILKNSRYEKQKLENDLIKLRNFYLENGYLRFKIKSTTLGLTPDKKGIYITINISEGNQYKISGVDLNCKSNDYLKKFKSLIKMPIGDIYSIHHIKQVKYSIKNFVTNNGYAYPIITTKYKIDDLNKKVYLYFNTEIGKRYYVHSINFQGNNISKDIVLRRVLTQMEGSWFNANLTNQSTNLLRKTGYFETVQLQQKLLRSRSDQIDLIYKVQEHKTGNIRFGLGLSKTKSLNFHINIHQINLFGTGNIFNINATKDNGRHQYELLFSNPFFTLDGVTLTNQIFYNRLESNNKISYGYNNISYGVDGTIGFPISTDSTLSFGLGYTRNNIYQINPQISIYRYLKSVKKIDLFKQNNFVSNDFNMNYGFTYNTLNQNIFPSNGNYTNLSSKIIILGLQNQFVKFSLDSSQYIPIRNQNWILLARGHLGYGRGIEQPELPFYENFFTDGINNIRGFQSNTIGPKSVHLKSQAYPLCVQDKKCLLSNDTIGGNAMFTGSIELIFPIPYLSTKYYNSVRTSLFFDFGNVWDTMWDTTAKGIPIQGLPNYNSPMNIRMSTGLSVQWKSPFGPLVFSYSIPMKKYDGDKLENFQFYVGKTW